MKEKSNLWPALLLMVVFAVTRWPGVLPWNFSAAYALAFCAGVYFPSRLSWWLPLAALLVTDILINVIHFRVTPISAYMLVNYASYALLIGLGRRFSRHTSWLRLLGGGLLGATLFYLVTNTAAWLQNPAYAKTLAGWIQALTIGEPGYPPTWMFFGKTLLSGGLFTGLFVGAMKLSEAPEPQSEKEDEAAPEPSEVEPEETQA